MRKCKPLSERQVVHMAGYGTVAEYQLVIDAAESSNTSVAKFIRDASVAAAKKVLGAKQDNSVA